MKTVFSIILFLSFNFFYSQYYPEKFEENEKYGVMYKGKIVLPAVYDRITLSPFIIATKGKQKTIYDKNMSLLYNNSEISSYVFLNEYEILQILTKKGKLLSYDEDGLLIADPLKLNPNETIDNKDTHFENGCDKYLIKNRKIHIINPDKDYFLRDFEYKKYGKNIKFLNNNKEMEIEYLYSTERKQQQDSIIHVVFNEEMYFEPLKTNYIVSKVKGKYGIWDFRDEKIILPYEYQKITPFRNYLLLKKNGLVTFYPNLGTEPKYKK